MIFSPEALYVSLRLATLEQGSAAALKRFRHDDETKLVGYECHIGLPTLVFKAVTSVYPT